MIAALSIAAVGLLLQPAHAGADQPIEAVPTASEPASLPPHFYRLANTRPGYETLCTEVGKLMAEPTIQPSCVQPQACVVRNPIPTGHPQFKQLEWQQLDVRSNWQIVRALTCFKFRLCNSVAALEQRPEVVAYLSEVLEPARAEDKLILERAAIDLLGDGTVRQMYRLDNQRCARDGKAITCSMIQSPLAAGTYAFDRRVWDDAGNRSVLLYEDRPIWLQWWSVPSRQLSTPAGRAGLMNSMADAYMEVLSLGTRGNSMAEGHVVCSFEIEPGDAP